MELADLGNSGDEGLDGTSRGEGDSGVRVGATNSNGSAMSRSAGTSVGGPAILSADVLAIFFAGGLGLAKNGGDIDFAAIGGIDFAAGGGWLEVTSNGGGHEGAANGSGFAVAANGGKLAVVANGGWHVFHGHMLRGTNFSLIFCMGPIICIGLGNGGLAIWSTGSFPGGLLYNVGWPFA